MEPDHLQNGSQSNKVDMSESTPVSNKQESNQNNHETKMLTITSTNMEDQIKKSDAELFSSLWEDKNTILGKSNVCMVKLNKKAEELESRERLLLLREQKYIESKTKMIQLHQKLLEQEVELLDKDLELKKRELILLDKENQTE